MRARIKITFIMVSVCLNASAWAQSTKSTAASEQAQGINLVREGLLQQLSTPLICAAQGRLIRSTPLSGLDILHDDDAEFVQREMKRRRLRVDRKVAKERILRRGINECTLFASWGVPSDANRSTGSFGVHVQYVYADDEMYIYTKNGKVSGWQD